MTKTLLLLGLMAVTTPALAQETTAEEPATDEPTEAPADPADGLDMGENAAAEDALGQLYVSGTHGDWEIRCVRTEEEQDPCQMHQTLVGSEGNAVAEVSMFPLPEGAQAAAGAMIAVPLMTLLTERLTLSVDGGAAKRYGYSWCDPEGCYARVGFTADDVASFKAGAGARVSLVPVVAPDQRVEVPMSLSGFTAAFDSLSPN